MIKAKRFGHFVVLTVVYFVIGVLISALDKGMDAALKRVDWKDIMTAIIFGAVMTAFFYPKEKTKTKN
jgi:fructose-specific phosphotransferase system IIC component